MQRYTHSTEILMLGTRGIKMSYGMSGGKCLKRLFNRVPMDNNDKRPRSVDLGHPARSPSVRWDQLLATPLVCLKPHLTSGLFCGKTD